MIRIAYEPDFLPLTNRRNGGAEGLVIDILEQTFAHAELAIEFVPIALSNHMKVLGENDAEAIAFKAITPGHDRGCDFSDPMIKTGAAWFCPAANPWSVADAVERPRVATPATGPLVATIENNFPELTIIKVASYDDSLKAVTSHSADVAALNFHIGTFLARRGYQGEIDVPQHPFEELDAALAVATNDPHNILEPFNQALAIVHSEGITKKIEAQWLG